MSEEQRVSDAPADVSDDAVQTEESTEVVSDNQDQKDSVALATHRKLLAQRKRDLQKFQEELDAKESQLLEMKEARLAEEGKKDEVIQSLKERLRKLTDTSKQSQQAYAYKVVSAQVSSEALKMGCIDTEGLMALADFTTLTPDDDFNVDPDDVKSMLEEVKEKRPYLFKKPVTPVGDGVPKNPNVGADDKEWRNMSIKDRAVLLAQMNQKK